MNQETNTHETMNRQLHEARGPEFCWHEMKKAGVAGKCLKCGECCCSKCSGQYPNPDYFSSLTDAFSLVEWCREEKGLNLTLKRDASSVEYFAMLSGMRITEGYAYHENPATAIATACYAALGLEEEK